MTDEVRVADRSLDAFVAEHVMGWKHLGRCAEEPDRIIGQSPDAPPMVLDGEVPRYSTDPAADYLVLQKVRETREPQQAKAFASELRTIWRVRRCASELPGEIWYAPGDYARAAKAVIEAR